MAGQTMKKNGTSAYKYILIVKKDIYSDLERSNRRGPPIRQILCSHLSLSACVLEQDTFTLYCNGYYQRISGFVPLRNLPMQYIEIF